MADNVIQDTFATTYNDDYRDSDNFYKVLFNNGRPLQQRELNQLQTIINEDVKGVGSATFRDGAAAVGGEIRVDNRANFIKLNTGTNALPTDTTTIEGEIFVEAVSGIKLRILKVVAATGSDPATLYVGYTDQAGVASTTTAIRITPGRNLTGETTGTILTSQTTNTTANPALGFGTLAFVNQGKFFVEGHMVFAAAQNLVMSKYDKFPSDTFGFVVSEQIITSSDNENLFDNSGPNLNVAAPGADRYKISLTLTLGADITAGQYYIKLANVEEGKIIQDANSAGSNLGTIKKVFNTYNYEQAGNYAIRNFNLQFRSFADNDNKMVVTISDGKAYVHGERIHFREPSSIIEDKPRSTATKTGQTAVASYGMYVFTGIGTATSTGTYLMKGVPTIDTYASVNLRSAVDYGGSTVGTARVRAVEKDNSVHRLYLFDIQMNSGQNFGAVRSIGTGTGYSSLNWNANLRVEPTGVVELQDRDDHNLFFHPPFIRPQTFEDISLTVAKRITGQGTSGSGAVTISASSGHTFADTSSWIAVKEADGVIDTSLSITNNGGTADITGLANSSDFSFLTYQTKTTSAAVGNKTKTKTNEKTTFTPASNNVISLAKADIYVINEIRDGSSSGPVITGRYTLDNGQRDNFYDTGTLTLKPGFTAPSGNVYVDFDYFVHSSSGDFFTAKSYDGQVDYKDIPNHRKADGSTINLRDVLDFRSRKANAADNFTGTGAINIPLPRNTETISFSQTFYLGIKGRIVISREGWWGIFFGDAATDPVYPAVPGEGTGEIMEIAKFQIFPYMVTDKDLILEYMDNRRYTMRDIGVLDRRLTDLEELTSLTMLELETNSIEVLDSDGLNRFKSGITADPFNNHAFSDIALPDYRAAIDNIAGEVKPLVNKNTIELVYDSDISTNTLLKGDNVYQKFESLVYKTQPTASRAVTVNGFEVQKLVGTIKLSPSSDNWYDDVRLADKIIINPKEEISENPEFNAHDHDLNWSGVLAEDEARHQVGDVLESEDVYGDKYSETSQNGYKTTTVEYRKKSRKVTKVVGESTRRENLGTFVREQSTIPVARAKFVSWLATGLKPNTRYFAFLNGISIDSYVNSTGGTGGFTRMATLGRTSPYLDAGSEFINTTSFPSALGGATNIVTNSDGAASGYFLIPNNHSMTFPTGKLKFQLNDISVFDKFGALSYGVAMFESAGILREVQDEIFATRIVQTAEVVTPRDPDEINRVVIDTTPVISPPPYIPPPPAPVVPVVPEAAAPITVSPPPAPPPVTATPTLGNSSGAAVQPSCFMPYTQIIMSDYSKKAIGDIELGDEVLGGECKSCGKRHGNKVIQIETPIVGPRSVFGINGRRPFVSEEHPMMTTEGWASINVETLKTWEWETYDDIVKEELKDIQTLTDKHVLKTFSGEEAIDNFVETDFPDDTLLYNLVLDGNNTYYAEDILVHNKCCSVDAPGTCGNSGGSCFVAGTMIEMAGRENCKIEDVEIGDELIGFDNVINTVVEFDHPKLGDRSLYAFNGGKPLVTAEHPFMTPGGWKAINQEATFEENPGMKDAMAGNLEVGDMISLHNGEWLEIKSIDKHTAPPSTQVYNFKLDGNNTYVANGMVVHNKGGGGTVICTALYGLGYLDEEIFCLDQKFGHMIRQTDPEVMRGYHAWGIPVADYIKGNGIGNKLFLHLLARPLAGSWAKQMAHELEPDKYKSNMFGKLLMNVGIPICRTIGKIATTKVKEV